MVWFYERQGKYLRYEVRQEPVGSSYELSVCYPDARVQVEHFQDPGTLIARFEETQGQLRHDGWIVSGPLDLQTA
jgi:hypothetical protein